jgi:aromatic-amino-acid transaminase
VINRNEVNVSFGSLSPASNDPLLALIGQYRADTRTRKIDLGVGVYRDADGQTPVFAAVKQAERRLAEEQLTKSYLGSDGDPEYLRLLGRHVFGHSRTPGLQTVGGTGALRLAADLFARNNPKCRVWLAVPTWPNHLPILHEAGLQAMSVETYDAEKHLFRPERLLAALANAAPGDAVLLHACCHNPTGIDPEPDFWLKMAEIMVTRGLIGLVDAAYQGLGRGWAVDGAGLNALVARVPHVLIAYSCDKNFGLYRERVGALFVGGTQHDDAKLLCNHLSALARANYSMPPDHGAAIVRMILQDAALTQQWSAEVDTMRARMRNLRAALAERGRIGAIDLTALRHGNGMFAVLGLAPPDILELQREFGIYVAPNGRINIAGLAEEDIDRFVDALRAVQCGTAA